MCKGKFLFLSFVIKIYQIKWNWSIHFNKRTVIPCQSQIVRPLLNHTAIESRNNPSSKSEVVHETKFSLRIFYSTHVWVAEWNRHLTSNPLMASVVSFNSHWRQLHFLLIFFRTLDVNFVENFQKC